MFPVVAMWGHRWGLDMTATTAMPDAVRTGLARSCGRRDSRCSSGTAPMSSTSFGDRFRPYRRAASFLTALRLMTLPSLTASIMTRTTSAMARTLASSAIVSWAWGERQFGEDGTSSAHRRGRDRVRPREGCRPSSRGGGGGGASGGEGARAGTGRRARTLRHGDDAHAEVGLPSLRARVRSIDSPRAHEE